MKSTITLAALSLLATLAYVVADDAPGDPAEAAVATVEQIDQWVSQLGDERFATRRDATEALVAVGQPAIEPVVSAALEGSAEVAVRCVQILRRLKDSADAATSEAAIAGLRQLADSDNAMVNERALAALDEGGFEPVQQPQFGGGGVQIQIQAGGFFAGNAVTIDANGERTVEVNENGKEIVIREHDGEDIEITITETVNGQEQTSEYTAENLEDLQQNHPDIAELYEKYSQQNPFQIQAFGQFQQMQQIPFAPIGRIAPPNADENQELASDIGSALERLAEATEKLEALSTVDDPDEDALQEVIEELNDIREELAETQDQLND